MQSTLGFVFAYESTPKPPYSFELTIHKPAGWDWLSPFEIYENGVIWSGFRVTSESPIGVKVSSTDSVNAPHIKTEVYAATKLSSQEQNEIKSTLSACLGMDEDVSSFYRLARQYPVLWQAVKDLKGMRDTPFPDLFTGMITAVTLQLAPIKRTKQMVNLLYQHFGEEIHFNGRQVILAPSPSCIVKLSEEALKDVCKLGFRARTLKACAKAIVEGEVPDLQILKTLPPDDVKRLLKRIKGFGDYSVDIIGIHPSFPVDSWSRRIFATAFNLEHLEEHQAIKCVRSFASDEFGRWQSYVYTYILNDLPKLTQQFGIKE